MATRDLTGSAQDRGASTEFTLHKKFNHSKSLKNVIDYTEYRLLRYAMSTKDKQQQLVIMALLNDYIAGKVAIAWKRGEPTYLRVTKNA